MPVDSGQAIVYTASCRAMQGRMSAPFQRQHRRPRGRPLRDYLAAQGFDVQRMAVDARGDAEPVEACGRQAHAAKADQALENCLQPNRRVEIVVELAPR